MTNTAKDYLAKGIAVVPAPLGKKEILLNNWPNLAVTNDNIGQYFPDNMQQNIAAVWGKEGSNLVDLDLDCIEALYFAEIFALKTGFVYGRKSKPRSHRVYRISGGNADSKAFKSPAHGMLVEIRGKGHASLLPGSFHPDGEVYEFSEEGEPAEVPFSDLHKRTALIAVCSLMVSEWPAKGGRQDMALHFAGALCKAGYSEKDVIAAVFHVAKLAGDDEVSKRREAAEGTVKRFMDGKPVKGMSGLKETLSEAAFKCLGQWLDISPEQEIEEVVDTMNAKYAFIIAGGKQKILVEKFDPDTQKREVDFIELNAFRGFFKNQKICESYGGKKPVYKSIADVWLGHPNRRSYEAMAFEPKENLPASVYNYYQGHGVEPIDDPKGKLCDLFLAHWYQVICGGDDDIFHWVIAWLADAVQNPGEKPGTAIVLIGPQGSGKSLGVEYLQPIFRPHYRKINDKEHLYGKFNAHQQGVILLLCEEISLAKDKKAMGRIKDLITSDEMMIERKGLDAVPVRNCLRMIVTSNDQSVIPADTDDRRFLVLEVSGKHANDLEYFGKLVAEAKNGGAGSLLNFLLSFDYSGVNLRKPPQTQAMVTQKIAGLEPVARAIYKFLLDGHIHPEGCEWPSWIETNQFQSICLKSIKLDGMTEKGMQTAIGTGLQKYLGPIEKPKQTLPKMDEDTGQPHKVLMGGNTEQQLVYTLPSLQECRKRFTKKTGIPFPDEDVDPG